MPRCGCSGTCACVLTTDSSLALSGNGSAQSPWLLRAVPNCDTTMSCVDTRTDMPLDVAGGRLGLKVSHDANQVLTTGTDGGLYVPGCVAGAVAISDTATVDLSGAGQTGNPLKADWLGNTINNSPASGVNLTGTGTPASPLHATWAGLSISTPTPEITVAGTGTPSSPLTLAWAGLPWSKFQAPAVSVNTGASNVNIAGWTLYKGHGGAGVATGGGDNHTFVCSRAGSYIHLFRLRLLLNSAQTLVAGGYLQVYLNRIGTGAGQVWDAIVSTYGAGWIDLNYVEQVDMADQAVNQYGLTMTNNSGSNATAGYAWTTWFRISD